MSIELRARRRILRSCLRQKGRRSVSSSTSAILIRSSPVGDRRSALRVGLLSVRDLICRSGGVFLSLEVGRRSESLAQHLILLHESGFLVQRIDGPHIVYFQDEFLSTWLVTCVAE